MTTSPFEDITLNDIPAILPMLSLPEQEKLLAELEQLKRLKQQKKAQTKFPSHDLSKSGVIRGPRTVVRVAVARALRCDTSARDAGTMDG